ncbi:MAG TPA: hypothetical protein VF123_11560 [Candidatus Sulfotelmatobacter sp.]
MDINKVALMLAIAALILAIPLSIAGNLLTPIVRDWYSTSSFRRLNRRIEQLTITLKQSQASWVFTPAEWEMYVLGFIRNQVICYALVAVMYLVLGISSVAVGIYQQTHLGFRLRTLPSSDRQVLLMATIGSLVVVLTIVVTAQLEWLRFNKNRRMHTTEGWHRIKQEIDRLCLIRYQREQQ